MRVPIIQAPMAGVSTPELVAAVSNAGGLGSLGLGAMSVDEARRVIRQTKERTAKPFNANFFCHQPARPDPQKEAAWLQRLAPEFARFNAEPPQELRELYTSFLCDEAQLEMLLDEAPRVASFHFGVPSKDAINALRHRGIFTLATATDVSEAIMARDAGIDAIVAQGWEAGGHRGFFDPDAPDKQLAAMDLLPQIVAAIDIPVIAAGGIMNGAGIAEALSKGAVAAQMGTAFITCTESSANGAYRAALTGQDAPQTVMTRAISGRPARSLENDLTARLKGVPDSAIPDYPKTYDASKALNAVAVAAGETGFGAQWAGQAAGLVRPMPAERLIQTLAAEMAAV